MAKLDEDGDVVSDYNCQLCRYYSPEGTNPTEDPLECQHRRHTKAQTYGPFRFRRVVSTTRNDGIREVQPNSEQR